MFLKECSGLSDPWRKPEKLKDCLSNLTKGSLTQIRKELSIKGVSHLNKLELIEALVEEIPKRIDGVLQVFDVSRYQSLNTALKNKHGVIDGEEFTQAQKESWLKMGILFPDAVHGYNVLFMPQEVRRVLLDIDMKNLKPIIERNTEWIHLVHGLLYYYGILNHTTLVFLVQKYTQYKMHQLEFIDVMCDAAEYYRVFKYRYDSISYRDLHYVHVGVGDIDQLIQAIASQPELPYCSFSKEELISAGEHGFIEITPELASLASYVLSSYDVDDEDVMPLMLILFLGANNGLPFDDIADAMMASFEQPTPQDTSEFLEYIREAWYNTRLWGLKGHTLNEIENHEIKEGKRVEDNIVHITDLQKRKRKKERS